MNKRIQIDSIGQYVTYANALHERLRTAKEGEKWEIEVSIETLKQIINGRIKKQYPADTQTDWE